VVAFGLAGAPAALVLQSRYDRLLTKGLLTLKEMAARYGYFLARVKFGVIMQCSGGKKTDL
jgi:hypothetical protein